MFDLCGPSRRDFQKLRNDVDEIVKTIRTIHDHQHEILERIDLMALDLTALTEEVTRLETVEASAVTLIRRLLEEVVVNKDDPVALQALVDRIKGSADDLAGAVAAGTPVDPTV